MYLPNEVIQVGQLHRTFGVDGGLKVTIEESFVEFIENKYDFLFVDMDGEYVPFRLAKWERRGDRIVYLSGVNDVSAAKELSGRQLYVPLVDLPQGYLEEHFSWSDVQILSEYSISLKSGGRHAIHSLEELPQQLMATLIINDREVMLPLVEDFVSSIDHDERIIYLGNLPEGLVDL